MFVFFSSQMVVQYSHLEDNTPHSLYAFLVDTVAIHATSIINTGPDESFGLIVRGSGSLALTNTNVVVSSGLGAQLAGECELCICCVELSVS